MLETVSIQIDGEPIRFSLDFNDMRWTAPRELAEGDFPLATDVGGKRYELYSDGTFAEVEL
jgi:hypothetical protein